MTRLPVQALTILVCALTFFFIWDFSQRAVTSAHLAQREQEVEQALARAKAKQAALIDLKRRVQSPEFVEDYVRRNWNWVREGDTLIKPQITPAPTPIISAPPPPPPPEPPWWQQVFDFLFGP